MEENTYGTIGWYIITNQPINPLNRSPNITRLRAAEHFKYQDISGANREEWGQEWEQQS